MPVHTMEGFRKEIERVNKKAFANLSAEAIYTRVEQIMQSPEDQWADAFVEYIKELNVEIYDKPSYYRTLFVTNALRWGKSKAVYGQYRITEATREARNLVNYCRLIINPESVKTFEYAEKQHAQIRDWQIERLKTFNEYAETERTMKAWDNAAVKKSFKSINESLELQKNSAPEKMHKFSGNYKNANDQIVANVYVRAKLFKEELEKHNIFWRWFTSNGRAYSNYVKQSNELFKKVGFNEERDGIPAIEYCKNVLPEVYSTDIDIAKGDYESSMEAYVQAHTPEIFDAREHTDRAAELNLDPEFGIESKLTPFAEKYGIEVSSIANHRIDWGSAAKSYDTRRDTGALSMNSKTTFSANLSKLISAAAKKYGADMNIADVLEDVRKIAVISVKFSSIVYDIDKIKDAEKPPYISDDFTPEYIEGRMDYFLKQSNLSPEVKARIAKEAAAHVKSWYENFDKLKKEDAELAATVTHPEFTDLSPVERKIINNLLTVGYRPPNRDDSKLLEKHTMLVDKMTKKWFSENSKHPDGAREVFAKNVQKLEALKEVPYRDTNAVAKLNEEWDKSDLEMNDLYPSYKPETLEDLQKESEVKYSISIELDDANKDVQKAPAIEDNNEPVKEKEGISKG